MKEKLVNQSDQNHMLSNTAESISIHPPKDSMLLFSTVSHFVL